MEDNQILSCPVTQEHFKDPRVLQCGHTIDKDILLNLSNKECPICKNDFIGNPENFPINWIVVSLLNLSINKKDQDSNPDDDSYTASKAKIDYYNFISTNSNKIESYLLDLIKKKANSGESKTKTSTNSFSLPVCDKVCAILKKKGYIAEYSQNINSVFWTVEFKP